MLSKRTKLLIGAGILCVLLILAYSEYRTKNFVHTFISDLDELEQKVDQITIWKQEIDSNISIASINNDDEQFNKVLLGLKEWQVKKLFFGDQDASNETYLITMTNDEKSIYQENTKVIMTKEGIMNINGRKYKLVEGPSFEEILSKME